MKNISRFIRLLLGGHVPLKAGFIFVVFCLFTSMNPLHAQSVQANGPYDGYVGTFAVSPASGGAGSTNLFAGTYNRGVFLSTNNGKSWTAVNTGLQTDPDVRAFAVSGTNLFAGTNIGVFLSTNNGTSWTAVNTGLKDKNVWSLAVNGRNLFARTGRGVWRRPL